MKIHLTKNIDRATNNKTAIDFLYLNSKDTIILIDIFGIDF